MKFAGFVDRVALAGKCDRCGCRLRYEFWFTETAGKTCLGIDCVETIGLVAEVRSNWEKVTGRRWMPEYVYAGLGRPKRIAPVPKAWIAPEPTYTDALIYREHRAGVYEPYSYIVLPRG